MVHKSGEFLNKFYPDAISAYQAWIKGEFEDKDKEQATAALEKLLNILHRLVGK